MIKVPLFLLSAAMCVACSSTSGVVPTGKDSYLIARSEKGFDKTGSRVKAAALKEAADYCARTGKTLEIIKADAKDMVPFKSDAQAEVEFRCV